MSMRPQRSWAALIAAASARSRVTSASNAMHSPPASLAVSPADAASRSTASTLAPSWTKRIAVARPLPSPSPGPCPAPMMTAILSFSLMRGAFCHSIAPMIDLAGVIRPGDGMLWGQACAEPQTLVEAVVAQRFAFSGASAFLGSSYSGIVKPEHSDQLRLASYCGTGTNRALADAGVLEIYPAPYSQLGSLLEKRCIPCDVVLLQVSPPNSRGEYSLGLAVEYLAPALKAARAVVAEVNDQVPWTHTEPLLRRKDFALIVESSRSPIDLTYRSGEIEAA